MERGEMKGQAGGRNAKRRGDLARGTTLGVRPEQKAEGAQAMSMSERAESANGSCLVHSSILLELSNRCVARRLYPRPCARVASLPATGIHPVR